MQVARHLVEHAFEDAKGACGMADYQVRSWQVWHHHMALVMVALMFLAKERLANRETATLLSCNDPVSYTHLDVYKRQPMTPTWWRTAARSSS